jgi:hypothetical protein
MIGTDLEAGHRIGRASLNITISLYTEAAKMSINWPARRRISGLLSRRAGRSATEIPARTDAGAVRIAEYDMSTAPFELPVQLYRPAVKACFTVDAA